LRPTPSSCSFVFVNAIIILLKGRKKLKNKIK
jgi:hypothetical protein